MNESMPKFRDTLSEKPQEKQDSILQKTSQIQESDKGIEEKIELKENQERVFKELDGFLEEWKDEKFESILDRPWRGSNAKLLYGQDAYDITTSLKEKIKEAIQLEVTPPSPDNPDFQAFVQFPYYIAQDGEVNMDGWAILDIEYSSEKPTLHMGMARWRGNFKMDPIVKTVNCG